MVGQEGLFESYVRALCEDIESCLSRLKHKRARVELGSIFFGGGTPNLLPARFYRPIFERIHAHASLSPTCEITLESNVNLISRAWCKELRALGANRLSIGIQSFDKGKLALLEREHSARESERGVEIAHQAGFDNLSCDLIIGSALDSHALIESDIARASALPLKHISVYSLSLDSGSRFASEGREALLAENEEAQCYFARECLARHGFAQYEVSNYERGARCAHNLGYWQGEEYLGVGASAVGRIGRARTRAHSSLQEYIKAPSARHIERLSKEDMRLERVMLGLRCDVGVQLDSVNLAETSLRILLDEGKCRLRGGYLVANELFLSDEITLWLLGRE